MLLLPKSRDGQLIFGVVGLRSFAYGFLGVMLGLYLSARGLTTLQVGIILTATLAGEALLTLLGSLFADRFGRRRFLLLGAGLASTGGIAYALFGSFPALFAIALLGTVSSRGKDRGAITALEQALLPQTCGPHERTRLFASYNLISSLSAAAGSLFAGFTTILQRWADLTTIQGYQAMFLLYSLLALMTLSIYWRLSTQVEVTTKEAQEGWRLLPGIRSRGVIGGLSGLFAVDAFGGGLVVQSFLAYWFHIRFGLGLEALGVIFFGSGILTSLSFLVAARLADRFGLINTMVFTHLPSSLFLIAVPLAPTAWMALTLFLAREALSQMDVPTRQSYTVAVVPPEDRTSAAGFTNLSRNVAQTFGPSLGGYMAQTVALGAPLVLGGALKVIYDLALYFSFRHIKPPEEVAQAKPSAISGEGR